MELSGYASFIDAANARGLRMLMVGGGAVNWHGYKRHSADVDFWIERTPENLERLRLTINDLGYEVPELPPTVKDGLQNVSLKFSPVDLDVECITRFSVGRSFAEAHDSSIRVTHPVHADTFWRVLAYEDLVTSKVKAGRPKDLLDIAELTRLRRGE